MGTTTTPARRHERPQTAPTGAPVRRAHGQLALGTQVSRIWDLLDHLLLARMNDCEPFAGVLYLRGIESLADIAPMPEPTFSVAGDRYDEWLILGDEWTFVATRRGDGSVTVTVSATTAATRDEMLAAIKAKEPPVVVDETTIPVTFWFWTGCARTSTRQVAAPHWTDVAGNYPRAIRNRIDEVMGAERPTGNGRVVLWHGPPGTGKTTAVRALARAWAPWCTTTIVTEPEVLFGSTGLIFDLVEDDEDSDRYQLLVVEDADELVRSEARSASGQALSRLLNLADGFLGQGMKIVILLTTNERFQGLHPAIARPGRALSVIEFPRFERAEAGEWLGRPLARGAVDASLAELIALRDGSALAPNHPPGGQYL